MKIWMLLVAALISTPAYSQSAAPVRTSGGQITGLVSEPGVSAFLGIPYAKPPTGEGRWRAPEPPAPFGNKAATAYGPSCIQANTTPSDPWSKEYYVTPPFSEDCLSLNIWTPSATAAAKLPVAVWIHGGGLVQGGSNEPIYDGSHLAKQGIVFVSINYRLGVLGFLAHPDLRATSATGESGNYGVLDDIAALKWVQANIAAFGGDPSKVTIVGQSAGARSVQALLFSPLAKGLFRGAIAESGIPFIMPGQNQEPGLRADMEAVGVAFATSRGVDSAAGLRALPVEKLIAPSPGTPFRGAPTVDGVVIPLPIPKAVRMAPVNDVPVLLGHNGDEGEVRQPLTQLVTGEAYTQRARATYGPDADRFLQLFPAAPDSTLVAQTSGHIRVMAGVQDWAAHRAANSRSDVYVYDFTHRMPGPVKDAWGSYHSSEIVYWTRNLDKLDRPWTAADRKLSEAMSTYWLNFIKTGKPNGPGLPEWRAVEDVSPQVMELGENLRMRPVADAQVSSFFKVYYDRLYRPAP